MNKVVWFSGPAREWLEGLPIGTGRLAAMVLGTVKRERLALNHEWLWTGRNRQRDTEPRAHLLARVRQLLLDGRYEEGTEAGNDAFGGLGGISGTPSRVDAYQTAGDLYFEFDHGPLHGYRRQLDLDSGIATVSYVADRKSFRREYVAHLGEDRILIRLTAGGQPFDCTLWLDRIHDPVCELALAATAGHLALDGRIQGGTSFRVEAAVSSDGGNMAVVGGSRLFVGGSRELLVAVNIGTSAEGSTPVNESAAYLPADCDWDALLRAHCSEYARNYGGFSLDLPFEDPGVPTDERVAAVRHGETDPGLVALYVNWGRYLLVASSAKGTLPANLQGKWCEDLNPPWQSDYHHDVNLQMNYWCAEPGHLHAYTGALFDHIERFVEHGRKAARDLYGCDGVWFPIQSDPWGRATPESCGWAVWIGAAPWLAQHMWWHYEYGQDQVFLRDRAYPFIRDVAAFYESYLTEDKDGRLQIVPSQSPENRFPESGPRFPVSLCVSSAMDVQLATDVLSHAIAASEILAVDPERRLRWRDMLGRLPALQVGSKGQLLEWNREFEEVEPGHRHISHLFGLFPGEQIAPDRTPDLFQAAVRSLELRLESMGGHTGWSRAWTACCFARAGHGNEAFEHVGKLITDFASPSLLDLHPPRIFQIEGNLGAVAAVLEMLLQSYGARLHLLPALPTAWPEGHVRGLRARGGYTVSIWWRDGQLSKAEIVPLNDGHCTVRDPGPVLAISDQAGSLVPVASDAPWLTFAVQSGRCYTLTLEQKR